MSARRYFRRILWIACFTTLLLGAAVVSPLMVSRLITSDPTPEQGALIVCLFIPTPADWPSHILSYAMVGVLLAGLLSGVSAFLHQWFRTRHMVRMLLQYSLPAHKHAWPLPSGLESKVDYIDLDKPVAFCYGWLRPRICLSTGTVAGLRPRELEALLLHEQHHLLCHDPLKTAMSRVLARTFFFLPLLDALQEQYLVAKEIEADEYVLRTQGTDRPLLGALYKSLVRQPPSRKATAYAVAGATDAINQRLDYLLDGRTPAGPRFATLFISSSVVAAIGTVVIIATWASAASALWHQAHSGLGGC